MKTRCILCPFEVDESELTDDITCCPGCGTKYIPLSEKYDVDIKINWQELRTLVIWAERWAAEYNQSDPEMTNCVRACADRLGKQKPEMYKECPLTFFGELKQLEKEYPDMQQNVIPD